MSMGTGALGPDDDRCGSAAWAWLSSSLPHQPPPPKPGTIASSSSSCPELSVTSGGFSPPPENTEDASPGRSRHQKRVVWSFDAETRM